jgi:Tol biopolymer transport system component/DNA-binding winged helix-turn-helix (wHTH) protein
MKEQSPSLQVVRFGVFEVDLRSGELRKQGLRIRLQEQPFRILTLLLERFGEVVSREELQQKLWPEGTLVDYDKGLNIAVKKLRDALGDSAENPRFVETLARRGYRFIAPLEEVDGRSPGKWPASAAPLVSRYQAPGVQRFMEKSRQGWHNRLRHWAGVVVLLTLAAAGIALYRWHRPEAAPEATPRITPLTSYVGWESSPALSPDGKQVAFSWSGEKDDNTDVYVKLIGEDSRFRLTSSAAAESSPAWSPDGRRIALLRALTDDFEVVIVPALGGAERRLCRLPRLLLGADRLSWSPDGRFLATGSFVTPGNLVRIFLISVETGGREALTLPPEGFDDLSPVFSPSGDKLAFIRGLHHGDSRRELNVLSLREGKASGEPRQLTYDGTLIRGFDWTPDGQSLVFSSTRGGDLSLWRISASGGEPQWLGFGGDAACCKWSNVGDLAISRTGARLVYQKPVDGLNIWRASTAVLAGSSTPREASPSPAFTSTKCDGSPQISPDGKRVAFVSNRSGSSEIWACDFDGTHAIKLTSMTGGSPRWSPDGREIAFDSSAEENFDVYVVSAEGGGMPRRLTTDRSIDARPGWSRDGRWIYFGSNRTGNYQVWKVPVVGGTQEQVTKHGGFEAVESPDGRRVYYAKRAAFGARPDIPGAQGCIWEVPVGGGEEQQVVDHGLEGYWAVTNEGIFLLNSENKSGRAIEFFSFASKHLTTIARFSKDTHFLWYAPGFSVTEDGRWLLFAKMATAGSDLILIENFS